jgi:hypothetical protein
MLIISMGIDRKARWQARSASRFEAAPMVGPINDCIKHILEGRIGIAASCLGKSTQPGFEKLYRGEAIVMEWGDRLCTLRLYVPKATFSSSVFRISI